MSYYKLIRMPKDGKAVRGRLFLATESRFEEVLIPICDTLENADYIIPALIYGIGVTQSPKFKRLLPIVRQVPGRSGIRFHRGTRPEHSKGCILISGSDEQQLTARWLAEQSAHEEIRLEICDQNSWFEGLKGKRATLFRKQGSRLYESEWNQLIIHLWINSQMYDYPILFQYDMDIILLPS